MRAVYVYIAALVCVSAAVPLDVVQSSDGDVKNARFLEPIILDLIEGLRDTILHGSDDLPVLDPLHIDELAIDDEIVPLPGARLSIADTTVKNLATFDVDELSVTTLLIVNRAIIGAYIPVIEIDNSHYDLYVTALGFNIFGTGRSTFKIIEPRVRINLEIRVGLGGLSVSQCTVNFSLGAFEPEITGLFDHEGASDFVNLFLKNLVPELLDYFEPEITEFLSELVKGIVEDALN